MPSTITSTIISVIDGEAEFEIHTETGAHVNLGQTSMVFFTPEAMHNFADQLKSAAEAWDSRNATETLNS